MKKICLICVAVLLLCAFGGCDNQNVDLGPDLTGFYSAVEAAVEKNNALNAAVAAAEQLLASEKPVLDETLVDNFKSALTAAKDAKVTIPEAPEEEKAIADAIKAMNAIDYSKVMSALADAQAALEDNIRLCDLVIVPDAAYVVSCLEKVPTVMAIEAATEQNDPNGGLNKPDGYTAQVFFTCELVDQNDIYGNTPLEKGTSAGGSVEVYATEEQAQARDRLLAYHDERTFDTGSHTVIGTVVVRTSVHLDEMQQMTLEKNILAALLGEEMQ
ncbi:MAG: hypothetical protein IJO56_00315 [Oscillospiraceae bacterium]|nr:hypothetical protein [Oscillospiraceae bacterium]